MVEERSVFIVMTDTRWPRSDQRQGWTSILAVFDSLDKAQEFLKETRDSTLQHYPEDKLGHETSRWVEIVGPESNPYVYELIISERALE